MHAIALRHTQSRANLMFTGIVQAIGTSVTIEPMGDDIRVQIDAGMLSEKALQPGDSIAVNGVCLTVTEMVENNFWTDVSGETLSRTTFSKLSEGAIVNLESALTPSTPLGGHMVSGHVDGIGIVRERGQEGRSVRFRIDAPPELARYIAEKGSICVDGISLTVNKVEGTLFDVNVVPHTLNVTTMNAYAAGQEVNLEVDIIARYLERLLAAEHSAILDRARIEF